MVDLKTLAIKNGYRVDRAGQIHRPDGVVIARNWASFRVLFRVEDPAPPLPTHDPSGWAQAQWEERIRNGEKVLSPRVEVQKWVENLYRAMRTEPSHRRGDPKSILAFGKTPLEAYEAAGVVLVSEDAKAPRALDDPTDDANNRFLGALTRGENPSPTNLMMCSQNLWEAWMAYRKRQGSL